MAGLQVRDWVAGFVGELTPMHAFRFAVLVLLPFVFGFWMLPHTSYANGQLLGAPTQSQSGASQTVQYTFTHNFADNPVPQQVNAVFPLANYLDFPPFVSHDATLICFEDRGSYVTLPNGTNVTPAFDWDVYFSNSTRLDVPANSVNCTTSRAGLSNDYQWVANLDIDLRGQNLSSNLTFVPKTATYPRFVMDYGLLQGLVMIPVFYLFLWYPAAGIWKKVHKGLGEQ